MYQKAVNHSKSITLKESEIMSNRSSKTNQEERPASHFRAVFGPYTFVKLLQIFKSQYLKIMNQRKTKARHLKDGISRVSITDKLLGTLKDKS